MRPTAASTGAIGTLKKWQAQHEHQQAESRSCREHEPRIPQTATDEAGPIFTTPSWPGRRYFLKRIKIVGS